MRNFTKEEINKLKKYWSELQHLESNFDFSVSMLEGMMQRDLKIEDIEFFKSDDGYCGIGNIERTIKLIQRNKLDN